ncbi:hypothetical protein [Saccharothrix obliqua]|uniref:hypothetical protein n=1 Tax=Saccharothrix obliqua TaxID=2861747 RepID=UPI001C5FDD71|nr:hypothetical protein [Saccharothrix obliqua]MBW4722405.1 hypothetical protein [Saccharothrix obliqua]
MATSTATRTATRTIEDILRIRRRAAEVRVVERAAAAARMRQQVETAIVKEDREKDLVELVNALRVAREALALVDREIAAQQGLDVEPVPYSPATSQSVDRYAGVLMLDDPELPLDQARAQAQTDENTRFEDYYARYHADRDDDEDTENDEV